MPVATVSASAMRVVLGGCGRARVNIDWYGLARSSARSACATRQTSGPALGFISRPLTRPIPVQARGMPGAAGLAGSVTWLLHLIRPRFMRSRCLRPPHRRDAAPVTQQPNQPRHQERPHEERVEQEAGDHYGPQLLDEG